MKSSEMKKATKRILAMLLCTSMVLSSGVSASADEGMAEQGHVHTESCYEKSKTDQLICTTAEGHAHGEECYEVTSTQEFTCTQEETEGHTHDDSCMETTESLICETEDHAHEDGCYQSETKMVCDKEETEGHTHGEDCYTTVENKNLICTLEEAEVHTHGDDCYAWEDKLVCTLPETAPAFETKTVEETAEQSAKEEEAAEVNLQNDDETGIKVSVKSTSDVIPEDTKVVVASMEMDEEHEAALAEAVGEFEVLGYTAYDISLKDAEDKDITLGENKVEVAIDFEEAIPEGINAEEVKDVVLVHITTDEEEKLAAETVGTVEITEEKATVEFETESFSPYVVTYLGETEEAVEEPYVQVLSYEDEDVQIFVEAKTADAIPENASLKVVPILPNSEETEEQYKSVEEELLKKAEDEEYEIAGFLAYDITFIDVDGNEIEPNGNVKVSMEYKKAVIPESVTAEEFEELDVTVMHFEEDAKGEFEEVVDMVEATNVEATVTTTEDAKVEKAEFVTYSFSKFTITWKYNDVDNTDSGGGSTGRGVITLTTGRPAVKPVTKPNAETGILTEVTKNAKVVTSDVIEESDRVFEITLGAGSEGEESGKLSVVLVLDASGSMVTGDVWKNVQAAAKAFISQLREKSPESKVGIVWYKGGHYTSGSSWGQIFIEGTNQLYELTDANVKMLNERYLDKEKSYFEGGTPIGQALDRANNLITSDATNENKYVVLFTDGRPGHNSAEDVNAYNWNCAAAKLAADEADDLIKNVNALFTVGYGTEMTQQMAFDPAHGSTVDTSKGPVPSREHIAGNGRHTSDTGTTGQEFLANYIASRDCAKIATNKEDITNYFQDIVKELDYHKVIETEKIVDTIDARFVLTPESRAALEKEGATITANRDGTTTVTWNNVTIQNRLDGGWEKKIQIQAREEFVGGNIVPTNKKNSGIYLKEKQTEGIYREEKEVLFPKPSVNVKLLVPKLINKEITVYKGDIVTSKIQLEEVIDSLYLEKYYQISEYTDGKNITTEGLPSVTLTDEQLVQLEKDGFLIINDNDKLDEFRYTYTYKGAPVGDPLGYFVYTITSENSTDKSLHEHTTEQAGSPVQKYQLEVKFVAYTQEERKQKANETIGVVPPITADEDPENQIPDGGRVVLQEDVKGSSTVNVIAGSIVIKKTFDGEVLPAEGDKFTFKIYKDGEVYRIVDMMYNENKEMTKTIEDLPRGTYKVTEEQTDGYTLQTVKIETAATNSYYRDNTNLDKTAEFSLGYYADANNKTDVIQNLTYDALRGGTVGAVTFKNKKVSTDWAIIKRSENSLDPVANAEFSLIKEGESDPMYVGISSEDGKVIWHEGTLEGAVVTCIPSGTYRLKETKAPSEFLLSAEEWKIFVNSDGSINKIQTNVTGEFVDIQKPNKENNLYSYTFVNKVLYKLPSTGGHGIYTTMLSGFALMLGAAYVWFTSRRKESSNN